MGRPPQETVTEVLHMRFYPDQVKFIKGFAKAKFRNNMSEAMRFLVDKFMKEVEK